MTSPRWEARRRDEWLRAPRWKVPHGAKHEDGISDRLVLFCRGAWPHVSYDLGAMKAERLRAEDLAAVETFREDYPAQANQVADVLALWVEDLVALSCACRVRGSGGVEIVARLLSDTSTYGRRLDVPSLRR